MVCIIDDREDVWNMASNLIQVKPYHFFQHTGDINAPPGLSKHELDGEGVDFKGKLIVNNILKFQYIENIFFFQILKILVQRTKKSQLELRPQKRNLRAQKIPIYPLVMKP